MPSGPKPIHGSLARSLAPFVHFDSIGNGVVANVLPPSVDTEYWLPIDPPSTAKRSCWKTAITRDGFVGSTAAHGSASESLVWPGATPGQPLGHGVAPEIA